MIYVCHFEANVVETVQVPNAVPTRIVFEHWSAYLATDYCVNFAEYLRENGVEEAVEVEHTQMFP